MTTYTRVTVLAADRKAEVVVPDSQTVAAVMPDLLRLLEHGPAPVTLTRALGTQLDPSRTLADQDVEDGCALWLTPLDQAPPPPEVTDITDLTAAQHSNRADLWSRGWSLALSTLVVATMAWVAASTLLGAGLSLTWVAPVVVALVVLACVTARRGDRAATSVLTGAATGAALPLGQVLVPDEPVLVALAVCWGLVGAVLAVVRLAGVRDTGLGGGAAVAAGLGLGLGAGASWSPDPGAAAAVVGVIAALTLALAPGIAMTVSGLARLDDRTAAGDEVPRTAAHDAVGAAYRALTAMVVATAVVIGLCGLLLTGEDPWARALVAILAVTTALRARVLPLVAQRLALVVIATGLSVAQLWGAAPVVAACIACLVLAGAAWWALARPSAVTLARLNRAGDALEAIALLGVVPVLLGRLGVFADLAGAFS